MDVVLWTDYPSGVVSLTSSACCAAVLLSLAGPPTTRRRKGRLPGEMVTLRIV